MPREENKKREAAQALRALSGDVDGLMAKPAFAETVGLLARGFVAMHAAAPRPSALFATQQRWLLCQAALARHFRMAGAGVTRRDVGHLALRHGIASRNTAYAFFDEIVHYGIVLPAAGDGRAEEMVPSPVALTMLAEWYAIHLAALDRIDAGTRSERFRAAPERLLPFLAPPLSDGLLASPDVRLPGPLYRIFAWTDAGGLLMDRLVAGIDRTIAMAGGGFLTDVVAMSDLARAFGLSRAHVSRKFSEAEAIGGIGWSGRRGYSRLWLSQDFYTEYAMAQARKLVIFRAAFAVAQAQASKMDGDDCAAFS